MQHPRRGRVAAVVFLAVALLTLGVHSPGGAATDESGHWTKERVGGTVMPPPGPNPYLANTPFASADYRAWDTYATHLSGQSQPAAARSSATEPEPDITIIHERQRNNDTPNRAQRLPARTRTAEGALNIIGRGPEPIEGVTTDAGFAAELDGSIPDAQNLPVLAVGDEVTGTGTIGDEVDDDFDFDFFALADLSAGDTIDIAVTTELPFGDLDPFVGFWAADGTLIAFNDDGSAESYDSRLQVTVPSAGTYYVSIGGFGAFVPLDPFDPSSPSDTGLPGSQGDYSYSIGSIQVDRDYYKIRLLKGDIAAANLIDGNRMELYGPSGELLIGSSQDLTGIHPASSPLPGGGNAALSYVIDRRGVYTLAIDTSADYVAELRGFRPRGDLPGRGTQVLFLDFDGGSVDTGIFGAPFGVAELSPLADFLPNWGLGPSDEDAVIDAIVDVVKENLEHDVEAMGGNRRFDIEIVDSRDGEPTGPLVSRIVVGGTIEEFGIGTVGIAQSIDVGNFETSETAVVLLDLLSAPAGTSPVSVNSYPLAPGASIIDAVAVGVGNVTAHEAGHFFANWHTDQFNSSPNIMDQGGNFPNTFGVGPDLIFGSEDDVDVDFGPDTYVPGEGFDGTENTLTSIAFGLWSHRH